MSGCASCGTPSASNAEKLESLNLSTRVLKKQLSPAELTQYLDQYIISQNAAKRAVSTALRARWRRAQLPKELRSEIVPKNILMVGPTGCGKTEIARRLSKLVDAPFVKVEATKFTEVGFHGRDVDQIIRDLVEVSLRQQRRVLEDELRPKVVEDVDLQVLQALVGGMASEPSADNQVWLKHLHSGALDDRTLNIELPDDPKAQRPGSKRVKVTVKEARQKLLDATLSKMITPDIVEARAIESVEEDGVVFIDEIDKIAHSKEQWWSSSDASAEGVQRDLLPIIEGSEVTTKYGNVKTDHILFICSGAFHASKPSDLLAELQGRLPIRVQLDALSEQDFLRILKEPKNSLIEEHRKMLATEQVDLQFEEAAVVKIAEIAWQLNSHVENIGARRLHTVFEKILEEVSFDGPELAGTTVTITADKVEEALSSMLQVADLRQHVL